MSFKELNLQSEYRTSSSHSTEEFYRMMLSKACFYLRATGYFSSTIYSLCSTEIFDFINKKGRIQIICSPILSPEDIDAIQQGYAAKEIADQNIAEEVDRLLSNIDLKVPVELLGTLVKLGVVEFRIAFCTGAKRIFHEKTGIFSDSNENLVSFKGSANETAAGWLDVGNHENIEVFLSWEEKDHHRISKHKQYLEELWENQQDGLEIHPFPEVPKERLIQRARNDINDFDPTEFQARKSFSDFDSAESVETNKFPISLRNHQKCALENWENNNCRGILQHATGSGKTITALKAIFNHTNEKKPAVILVPSALLLKQWDKEIKDKLNVIPILCGDGHTKWRKDKLIQKILKQTDSKDKFIIIAIQKTACSDEFLKQLKNLDHVLLVADEMHRYGTNDFRKFFEHEFGKRLGLSATPKRYGDPEGTNILFSYFEKVLEPIVTLSDAIKLGLLTEYEYFPEKVELTPDEQVEWEKLTKRITRLSNMLSEKKENNHENRKFLEQLFINRSRIAKKASNKTSKIVEIIEENFIDNQHWLIYCEDNEQLEIVRDQLISRGFSPYAYTSSLDSKEHELRGFIAKGGIMLSIRCLDEGVDMPIVSHALIASSSQNPRQFIQRRGRVLRKHSKKDISKIWDCLTVPINLDTTSFSGHIKQEIIRAAEFSKDANNSDVAEAVLREILISLDEDPEGNFEIKEDEDFE